MLVAIIKKVIIVSILIPSLSFAYDRDSLSVPNSIWERLTPSEQSQLGSLYFIETFDQERYGEIIDVQMVNESTYNNGSMAEFGSRYARAAYIDNNWRNYSATDSLTAGVVGGLIGSLVDQKTEIKYHFRYTLKQADGDIIVKDVYQKNKFSHPRGACTDADASSLVNSKYCQGFSVRSFRNQYLSAHAAPPPAPVSYQINPPQAKPQASSPIDNAAMVTCKIGTAAVMKITASKCNKINGVIIK